MSIVKFFFELKMEKYYLKLHVKILHNYGVKGLKKIIKFF